MLQNLHIGRHRLKQYGWKDSKGLVLKVIFQPFNTSRNIEKMSLSIKDRGGRTDDVGRVQTTLSAPTLPAFHFSAHWPHFQHLQVCLRHFLPEAVALTSSPQEITDGTWWIHRAHWPLRENSCGAQAARAPGVVPACLSPSHPHK